MHHLKKMVYGKSMIIYLLYTLMLSVIMILPDFLYTIQQPGFFEWSMKSVQLFFLVFFLNLLILGIGNKAIQLIFFSFFTLLSAIEMIHYSFFHGPLLHYEITFFFTQFTEVTESLEGVLHYMFFPLLLWILQWTLGYIVINRFYLKRFRIFGSIIMILVLLLAVPVSTYSRHNISSMMPKNTYFSFLNMYNSLSLFVGKEIPKFLKDKIKSVHFESYNVVENNLTRPQTIIVIMGESLGYKHMHLYGAQKMTTPRLDTFINDQSFVFKKAYASGVDTLTAVPTFFLIKREPQNMMLLGQGKTNLFTLAKKHGYKTMYFTTQKLNIMAPYISSVDVVKRLYGKDEVLIESLKKIDFRINNFVVLHQRNSHSPYEDYTPQSFYQYTFKDKSFHEYMENSYANSILYTDYLVSEVIKVIQKHENTLLIMVPDHAEMMGLPEEGGRYGHAYLDREVAKIPFIAYANHVDDILMSELQNIECVNHYIVGKLVAKALGYHINNANENGSYFINGTNIDGSNGWIEYTEKECERLNREDQG